MAQTQLTVKWRKGDIKIVRSGLENLRADLPRIGRMSIFEAMRTVVGRMKDEPPEIPGQRYVRTGKLSRNWKILRKGDTGYTIINRASFKGRTYARWVVGDFAGERQARVHQGRWKVLRVEVETEMAKLPAVAAKSVRLRMRKSGWK